MPHLRYFPPSLPPSLPFIFNSTNKLYLIFGCLSSSTFFPFLFSSRPYTCWRKRLLLQRDWGTPSPPSITSFPPSPHPLHLLSFPLLSCSLTKFFLLFFPRHPHVVQVYGACVYSPTEIWLVMEYADGGSLFSKLADRSVVCVSSFSYLLSFFSPSSINLVYY